VEFRFPAGKYHATPWNRQVNEGIVEWPPNPWRIVRALISTYYLKMSTEYDESMLIGLIDKLSDPPLYSLPDASLGHTRHYMPLYHTGKSSLIFDTFASVDKEKPLFMIWPDMELNENEKRFFTEALKRIQYLGRAESWVEARMMDEPPDPNCYPLEYERKSVESVEMIDVMIPMKTGEYSRWVENWEKEHTKGKKNQVPEDMLSALCVETTILKKNGWSQPPGSKWVKYIRASDCFDVKPEYKGLAEDEKRPTVARYQVASQAPPRLTDALSLSERIHTSLVKYSDQSPIFTGCDENKEPLKDHGHTHIICESNISSRNGKRGEITHVTLFAPDGFGMKERKAIDILKKVWGHGGHDVQMVLLGVGDPDDFAGKNQMAGQCPLFIGSKTWHSRTPFVSTTHPKYNRKREPKVKETDVRMIGQENEHVVHVGSPEYDLIRLLGERGFPQPESIEKIKYTNLAGKDTYWLNFRTRRKTGSGSKGPSPPTGFKIRFREEVKGPITLGFGSHFGLGLFIPIGDKEESDRTEP
ncbi:MAG: type I-U CRISPR-associated protein Csb2, partial [Candidatus Thermoplasmatota archaeon]|nr:type I-U CRISPR-associated protein Csb2 [Candidatus Thermoplasmatota archaeon]